ncbi:MAG: hypothetical protein KDH94_09115, partial [Coxiellaceae bacterium]|nr:hypothetical protein [Coxiellaceae bacterium]
FSLRYLLFAWYDVPLYNHAKIGFLFISIGCVFLTIQFLGKYGPLYRSQYGRRLFTQLGAMFGIIGIIHVALPIPSQVASYFQYTAVQVSLSEVVNRIGGLIEVIASVIILVAMQLPTSVNYYRELKQTIHDCE